MSSHLPRFKAGNMKEGMQSVVGDCNGHSCEERFHVETPLFARAILSHLPNKATSVLDYGCGVGRLAKEVLKQNPKVTVIGVDVSEDELRLAREYVADSRFVACRPNEIPHKADLIYSIYVLQHVPAIELRHAIERMHYYLKPGGTLVYCSSDYRMAINLGGGFTDDSNLGVDIRKELSRLFEEVGDLEFGGMSEAEAKLISDMITAKDCPNGSIPHPAKVYRARKTTGAQYFMDGFPGDTAPDSASERGRVMETTTDSRGQGLAGEGSAKRLVLRNRLSPGDILVMSAAIRALHKAYPGRFETAVDCPVPEIFENNPYVVQNDGSGVVIDMHYPLISDHTSGGFTHPGAGVSGRHFSDGYRRFLAETLELEIPRSGLVPEIYLNQDEQLWPSPVLAKAGHVGPYWVLNAGSKSDFTLKQYHRWQEVVDLMKKAMPEVAVVQIGAAEHNHPALRGVIDLRGQTGHRELYRTIHHAEGVLTCVSYPMHVAAAFSKPCVVVAGGREAARWEYYPNHRYLAMNGALPCAAYDGCWKSKLEECASPIKTLTDGPGGRGEETVAKCMEMTQPDDIVRAVGLYYQGGILTREGVNV